MENVEKVMTEVREFLTEKKVPFEEDELFHIRCAVESIDDSDEMDEMGREIDALKDENSDLQDEVDELRETISDLEETKMECIEVFSNDVIRFEEPKNMQDRFIIEALILCFKAGKPNDLLVHLASFATQHNTTQLVL